MIFFRLKKAGNKSKGSLIKTLLGFWLLRKLWPARKQHRGIPPQGWAISAGVLGAASLATYLVARHR